MNTRRWNAAVAAVLLLGAGMALAAPEPEPDPAAPGPTLQQVMVELDRNLQAATGAISREDWAGVVQLAPHIAAHDEPDPAELRRILAWLGTEVPAFKQHDLVVHEAAEAMGAAAARADGEAVIAAFARVQSGCLACHQAYRARFVAHFRGEDNAAD